MRVLVTGASGFVGRQCVAALARAGHEVHAVGRKSAAVRGGASWHTADLLLQPAVKELVQEVQAEALLHLAWYVVPKDYKEAPQNEAWVDASMRLFEAFARAGGRRIAAVGSCMEYDWSDGVCVENVTPLKAQTLYGRCKSELSIRLGAMAERLTLSWAWPRLFFLFGPYEQPGRLIPHVTQCLLRGERARCSPGEQVRDFLYVEDVGDALAQTLLCNVEGPVNIGSGEGVAVREIVGTIGKLIGRTELIDFGALPPVKEPLMVVAKTDRLHLEVGWKPRYNLTKGLEQTIEWWRQRERAAGVSA